MPFTPYKSSLDPYALAAAQDAFDMAWLEIEAAGGYDMQPARNLLAERIVEAAMIGERDPGPAESLCASRNLAWRSRNWAFPS